MTVTGTAIGSHAAILGDSRILRLMALEATFLARLSSAPAAWCAAMNGGRRIDPEVPFVYWLEPGGVIDGDSAEGIEVPPDDFGVEILESDPTLGPPRVVSVGGDGGGFDADALPLADFMSAHGMFPKALVFGRFEGAVNSVVCLLDGEDGSRIDHAMVDSLARLSGSIGEIFELTMNRETWGPVQLEEPISSLSTRETQVAVLASQGAHNSEIALELGISTGTVKAHLHRVFEKLHVDSRTKLALMLSELSPDEPG